MPFEYATRIAGAIIAARPLPTPRTRISSTSACKISFTRFGHPPRPSSRSRPLSLGLRSPFASRLVTLDSMTSATTAYNRDPEDVDPDAYAPATLSATAEWRDPAVLARKRERDARAARASAVQHAVATHGQRTFDALPVTAPAVLPKARPASARPMVPLSARAPAGSVGTLLPARPPVATQGLQATRVGVRPSLPAGDVPLADDQEYARLQERVATLQRQVADRIFYQNRAESLATQLEAAERCQICQLPNHLASSCPERYNCQICGTRGHSALSCPIRYDRRPDGPVVSRDPYAAPPRSRSRSRPRSRPRRSPTPRAPTRGAHSRTEGRAPYRPPPRVLGQARGQPYHLRPAGRGGRR